MSGDMTTTEEVVMNPAFLDLEGQELRGWRRRGRLAVRRAGGAGGCKKR